MKCSHCGKTIVENGREVLLNQDGDFACNTDCATAYIKGRDHFFNNVVNDNAAFVDWMGLH